MTETEVKLPIFRQTFPKEEKLTSKKEIESLFKSGKTLFSFPYKIYFCYADKEEKTNARVLITVPKRQFKKAVDRNRIKRLFREAYRRNKFKLDLSTSNKPLLIAFLYVHSEIVSYAETEKKIKLILDKINQQIAL